MIYRPLLPVVLIVLLTSSVPILADDVIDELTTDPAMMGAFKTLGILACSGNQNPEALAHDKAQVRNAFWAFRQDVHLTDKELSDQSTDFDQMWDRLISVSRDYDVNQVSLIGCDEIGGVQCLDVYLAGFTPRGPVLFKFSVEFGVGRLVRIFRITTSTDWDKIKEITRGIRHTTDPNRTPTITRKQQSASPATNPTAAQH